MYYSVKLISAMGLYIIIVWMCFIIPVVSTHVHHYDIYVSLQSKVNSYQRVTDTLRHCSSLIPMFKLLSSISNFTDVFIQSGMYSLNMLYTLRGLHNIQIRSNSSKPAVITCQNNSNVDTGVALLQVSNIIIDHWSIVGCGMKQIGTSYHVGRIISFLYTVHCVSKIVLVSFYWMSIFPIVLELDYWCMTLVESTLQDTLSQITH